MTYFWPLHAQSFIQPESSLQRRIYQLGSTNNAGRASLPKSQQPPSDTIISALPKVSP
jgi:hypothetical protein